MPRYEARDPTNQFSGCSVLNSDAKTQGTKFRLNIRESEEEQTFFLFLFLNESNDI